MKAQSRTANEQYQLIMECRTSGLSDYQWCTEHDIKPGTVIITHILLYKCSNQAALNKR